MSRMRSASELLIGQPVHGVITKVRPAGLDVELDFGSGFVPSHETGLPLHGPIHHHFAAKDEIDAWLYRFGPGPNMVTLTLIESRATRSAVDGPLPIPAPVAPDFTWGEGVPYWQLAMQRRSKKNWHLP